MRTKNKIIKDIIEAWKPIFELYPKLKRLPVYAWGRYYKYECAGESFEIFPEPIFGDFKSLVLKHIDWDLIEEIDNSDVIDSIDNCEIGDWNFERREVVHAWNWDERAGKCLIVSKDDNDSFELLFEDCDSPE